MTAQEFVEIVNAFDGGELSVAQECFAVAQLYRYEMVDAEVYLPSKVGITCRYLLGLGVVRGGEYLSGARVDGQRCQDLGGRFSA